MMALWIMLLFVVLLLLSVPISAGLSISSLLPSLLDPKFSSKRRIHHSLYAWRN